MYLISQNTDKNVMRVLYYLRHAQRRVRNADPEQIREHACKWCFHKTSFVIISKWRGLSTREPICNLFPYMQLSNLLGIPTYVVVLSGTCLWSTTAEMITEKGQCSRRCQICVWRWQCLFYCNDLIDYLERYLPRTDWLIRKARNIW